MHVFALHSSEFLELLKIIILQFHKTCIIYLFADGTDYKSLIRVKLVESEIDKH